MWTLFSGAGHSDEALLRILETLWIRGRRTQKSAGDVFPADRAPALADGRMLSMRWGFALPGVGRSSTRAARRRGKSDVSRRGALPFAGQRLLRMGRRSKTPLRLQPAGAAQSIWPASGAGTRTGKGALSSSPAKPRRRRRACTRACPCCSTGALRRAWLDARNPLPELLRAAVGDVCIVEAGILTQKRWYDTISAVYTKAGGAL